MALTSIHRFQLFVHRQKKEEIVFYALLSKRRQFRRFSCTSMVDCMQIIESEKGD
jgi:hypothetical protein